MLLEKNTSEHLMMRETQKNWKSQLIDLNQKPSFEYTDPHPCAQIRSRLGGHRGHFERSGKYKAKNHD